MPKANKQRLSAWVCRFYDLLLILLRRNNKKRTTGLGGDILNSLVELSSLVLFGDSIDLSYHSIERPLSTPLHRCHHERARLVYQSAFPESLVGAAKWLRLG